MAKDQDTDRPLSLGEILKAQAESGESQEPLDEEALPESEEDESLAQGEDEQDAEEPYERITVGDEEYEVPASFARTFSTWRDRQVGTHGSQLDRLRQERNALERQLGELRQGTGQRPTPPVEAPQPPSQDLLLTDPGEYYRQDRAYQQHQLREEVRRIENKIDQRERVSAQQRAWERANQTAEQRYQGVLTGINAEYVNNPQAYQALRRAAQEVQNMPAYATMLTELSQNDVDQFATTLAELSIEKVRQDLQAARLFGVDNERVAPPQLASSRARPPASRRGRSEETEPQIQGTLARLGKEFRVKQGLL